MRVHGGRISLMLGKRAAQARMRVACPAQPAQGRAACDRARRARGQRSRPPARPAPPAAAGGSWSEAGPVDSMIVAACLCAGLPGCCGIEGVCQRDEATDSCTFMAHPRAQRLREHCMTSLSFMQHVKLCIVPGAACAAACHVHCRDV